MILEYSCRRDVAIFRQHLFKASETFINAQVRHLERYRPVYVGRKICGRSHDASVILSETSKQRMRRWCDTIRGVGFRNPELYIEAILNYKKPDIMHAHFSADGVYALEVARGLGVPLVTTLHGFDVTRTKLDLAMSARPVLMNLAFFENNLKKSGDAFICVSEFIRKKALERGYPEEKLYKHYIGVDVESIAKRPHENEVDGLIVHVARLVEKKGTIYLLRAFASVVKEYPGARLVIIGDGPLRGYLERSVHLLGISSSVKFLGEQPHSEVIRWDSISAMKVVPSVTASNGDQEGLGIVNLEAAALGVPVVAFDSGGIGEAVKHGLTGFLAKEADVDELASCIKILLHNKEMRYKFGSSARKFIERDFDIKKQTMRLEGFYDDIIDVYKHR
jgi:colanic acid/amylovoran biosynthesis glycosyltransferase